MLTCCIAFHCVLRQTDQVCFRACTNNYFDEVVDAFRVVRRAGRDFSPSAFFASSTASVMSSSSAFGLLDAVGDDSVCCCDTFICAAFAFDDRPLRFERASSVWWSSSESSPRTNDWARVWRDGAAGWRCGDCCATLVAFLMRSITLI